MLRSEQYWGKRCPDIPELRRCDATRCNGLNVIFLISTGLTLLLVAATIVLSSTAGAAEQVGNSLGEFVEAGEHEGRPYYIQRDTEGRSDNFLYSEGGKWLVDNDLGGSYGRLKNRQDTPLPPRDNWPGCHKLWLGFTSIYLLKTNNL